MLILFLYNQIIMLKLKLNKSIPSLCACSDISQQSTPSKQYRNPSRKLNLPISKLFQSENGEEENQSQNLQFQSINSDSKVSLEDDILTQHLQCLQYSISRLVQGLFQITSGLAQSNISNQLIQQEQHTFVDYFTNLHSLIPQQQLPIFMKFIERNNNCRKIVKWIYEKVQARLGDELILVVHRIIVAYLPVKYYCRTVQQIMGIVDRPFNIFNIFADPSLRLIGVSNLIEYRQTENKFNSWRFDFYKSFLSTILLVLEEYFENPCHPQVLREKAEMQQKVKEYRCLKASKKIKKANKMK